MSPALAVHLVALLNVAYARHSWLIPDGRTDDDMFAKETAGKHLLLVRPATAVPPLTREAAGSEGGPVETDAHSTPGAPNTSTSGVGTASEDVVGMAVVSTRGDALYLEMVAVAPDAQGQGVAGRLAVEAEREARRRGLRRLSLNTFRELGNETYWRRHGFTPVSEERQPQGTIGATAPFTIVWMERAIEE